MQCPCVRGKQAGGHAFTCAAVELVLDGVLDLVLNVAGHVVLVRNVPVGGHASQCEEGGGHIRGYTLHGRGGTWPEELVPTLIKQCTCMHKCAQGHGT